MFSLIRSGTGRVKTRKSSSKANKSAKGPAEQGSEPGDPSDRQTNPNGGQAGNSRSEYRQAGVKTGQDRNLG